MKKIALAIVFAFSITSCSWFEPKPPPLLDSKRKSCVEKNWVWAENDYNSSFACLDPDDPDTPALITAVVG